MSSENSKLKAGEQEDEARVSDLRPVQVVASGHGAYFVWSITDAERLRCDFRIVGEWVGSAPNHVGQNQFLALPLALSAVEVALGLSEGFMILEWAPWTSYMAPSAELRDLFEKERETCRQEQLAADARLAEQRRLQFMAEEEWRIARHRQRARHLSRKRHHGEGEGAEPGLLNVRTGNPEPLRLSQPSLSGPEVEQNPQFLSDHQPSRKRARLWLGSWPLQAASRCLSSSAFHHWFDTLHQRLDNAQAFWQRSMRALGAFFSRDQQRHKISEHTVDTEQQKLTGRQSTVGSVSTQTTEAARVRPYRIRIHTGRAPYEKLETKSPVSTMVDGERFKKDSFWMEVMRSDRFLIFRDLWRRGFYLTTGHKFGADFLAYAHDPCLFHAGLCVTVMSKDDLFRPRDIISAGRLGVATKKRATLACVENVEQGLVSYRGIAWCESLP
jgi:hypothetical protein